MSFNLNDAPDKSQNVGPQYQKPGISENTVVTEAVLLSTSANQVPYMELRTTGPNGELGKSNKMFLSTDVKEGKKMSAWAVTSRNIVDLIVATHNVDEPTAKNMLTASTKEEVVTKVSTILVGRPFRAKFKGKETVDGKIYASLDSAESMKVPSGESKLKFDAYRDITKEAPFTAAKEVMNQPANTGSDLPF